jgi:hypothetical protein
MPLRSDDDELLSATQDLLYEARALLDGGEASRTGARTGVLGLYDALCRALDGIDGDRIHGLLARIAERVEKLNELSADLDRLRHLRASIRSS